MPDLIYMETSIPAGMTIPEYRRSRQRTGTSPWWKVGMAFMSFWAWRAILFYKWVPDGENRIS